ncbi:hypothetical protein M3Y99_01104000 [Aphelenchoides fujianensis]|nr:hypothetical protein M3Y99_01104000 [Aphelenchoides fujianensis]
MEDLPNLEGPNVCEFHQRLTTSTSAAGVEEEVRRVIRVCCAGYEPSVDGRTCSSKMDFLNFHVSENFSLALIALALLFLFIGIASMIISYRFYYRHRLGRKSQGILAEEDVENHEDTFVVGIAPRQVDDHPYKPIVRPGIAR